MFFSHVRGIQAVGEQPTRLEFALYRERTIPYRFTILESFKDIVEYGNLARFDRSKLPECVEQVQRLSKVTERINQHGASHQVPIVRGI